MFCIKEHSSFGCLKLIIVVVRHHVLICKRLGNTVSSIICTYNGTHSISRTIRPIIYDFCNTV